MHPAGFLSLAWKQHSKFVRNHFSPILTRSESLCTVVYLYVPADRTFNKCSDAGSFLNTMSRLGKFAQPWASSSKTSFTRIQYQRMQGRPPHFPGSMVIRSAYDIRRKFNPLPGYRKTPWLQPGEWPMEFETFDVIGNCRFGLGRMGSKRIVAIHGADRRPAIAIAFRVPYAFQSKERFAFSKRNLSAGYRSSLSRNKVRLVDLRRPSLCYRPQNKELST